MALFDDTASTYDDWCQTPLGSYVDQAEKQLIISMLSPKEGESALDLGCGTGIYSLLLSEMGLRVTGIDASAAMLEKAKEKALRKKKRIDFMQGDIHALPFPDQSFDMVISNIVLEFVEKPHEVVAEALRVLKPGGRLVIGFIGQKSEWATKYQKQGNEKPASVFSQAHFFDLVEIFELHPKKPSNYSLGLYLSPNDFTDIKEALLLEQQRAMEQKEDGAGFLAVKWVK